MRRPAVVDWLSSELRNVAILGLGQEDQRDHEAHCGNRDRIPQARIDIPRGRHDGEHGGRQEAAEPAVADVKLVVALIFLPETKDRDITQPLRREPINDGGAARRAAPFLLATTQFQARPAGAR